MKRGRIDNRLGETFISLLFQTFDSLERVIDYTELTPAKLNLKK